MAGSERYRALSTRMFAAAMVAVFGLVLVAPAGGTVPACSRGVPAGPDLEGELGKQGSWGPRLSADGRYVTFVSYEENLVAGDTNQDADVFLMDRSTRQILRVSLDTDGSELKNQGPALGASISADGTRVAFSSGGQVYVRDIPRGQTIRGSVDGGGAPGDAWSGKPILSPDGGFVAFTSRATNLVPSDRSYGSIEAYLRDLQAGTTERISIGDDGVAASTWSWAGAVSDGGRHVAFTAGAAGGSLTDDDTYAGSDVFVRDRQTGMSEMVSVGPDRRSMGGWFLGMSADGTRILFGSGPQPDSKPAALLRDRTTRTTRLVAPLVTTWNAGPPAALSADGHRAAIQTSLPTGPDDTNAADDIALLDLGTGTWRTATRFSSECAADGASGGPALSHDGSTLAFTSEADDLAGSDTHHVSSVYVRNMRAGETERVSAAP